MKYADAGIVINCFYDSFQIVNAGDLCMFARHKKKPLIPSVCKQCSFLYGLIHSQCLSYRIFIALPETAIQAVIHTFV